MKKIITLLCIVSILVCSFGLVSCGEKTYKLGVGIYANVNAIDADGETSGSASVVYTMAALIIDEDGKVVNCAIDSTYYGDVSVSSTGVCTIAKDMTTKQDLGEAYGMSVYANTSEWNVQADAFASVTEGKTLDEIKNLVADSGKGSDEVINAGCTIDVTEFALAIEKAFANTKSVELSETDVNIGVAASSDCMNADGEDAGSATFNVSVTAAAMDGEKIVACITDECEVSLSVNSVGVISGDDREVKTKRELGDSYGMVAYGASDVEWYAQVDAFDTACEGKNADEIAALVVDGGKGTEDVQSAGCTIAVSNYAKSAVDAASVK